MRISASPTAIERRQFGELADDVAYLRHDCGQVIAPYRDGFRVGQGAGADVITADQLVARAQRERDRRTAGRAATVLPKPSPEMAMKVVSQNLQRGNHEVISRLAMAKGGTA